MGNVIRRTGTSVSLQPADGGTATGTATASCSSGETAIGGGFTLTGINTNLDTAYPTSNFPSSFNTWSTTMVLFGTGGDTGSLTAYVLCVAGSPPA